MGVELQGNSYIARYKSEGKRIYVGSYRTRAEASYMLSLARGEAVLRKPLELNVLPVRKLAVQPKTVKKSFLARCLDALNPLRSNTGSEK